ncbi:MAG TPA: hypothetical protein VMV27_17385 [Candidatus Binataceae bacterium]|nr:hypothetical protein [Candidatus Binataceae bacterium]
MATARGHCRGAFGIAIALSIAAYCTAARAQVGDRNFIEPFITEDPNPSNELELQPAWNRAAGASNFQFAFSQEKTLSPTFSIEIGDAVNRFSRTHEASVSGMSDLQILPKWAFYTSVEHEMRIALGAEIFPSTGDIPTGAYSHTRAGPMLMFAKGAGDLPDTGLARYLRPLALQADAGYLPTWRGPESDFLFADACIAYQFYYLSKSGLALPIASQLDRLAPFVEFDYQQIAFGSRFNTPPDFRVTPALAYGTDTYQMTVGAQVGINSTGNANNRGAVLVLLDLYMDRLWPAVFGWNPL